MNKNTVYRYTDADKQSLTQPIPIGTSITNFIKGWIRNNPQAKVTYAAAYNARHRFLKEAESTGKTSTTTSNKRRAAGRKAARTRKRNAARNAKTTSTVTKVATIPATYRVVVNGANLTLTTPTFKINGVTVEL